MTDAEEIDTTRRLLLRTCIGLGAALTGASLLTVATGLRTRVSLIPASSPPQAGDVLVYAQGPRQGQPVSPDALPAGGPSVLAWPMEPHAKVVRNARRENLVLLVRAGAASWLGAATRRHAAGDVVAYSATCTHLCCTVSAWERDVTSAAGHGAFLCPCHSTVYDPWSEARVLSGPAPRPLPVLPLAASAEGLTVVQGFIGRVGC